MYRAAQLIAPERPKVVRVHTLENLEVILALLVLEAAGGLMGLAVLVKAVVERG
jgi:hypothetical protein